MGDLLDKLARVGFGIEVGPVAVFEDGIHHPHVHQQPLGLRAAIGHLAIEMPPAVYDGHLRVAAGSERRNENNQTKAASDQSSFHESPQTSVVALLSMTDAFHRSALSNHGTPATARGGRKVEGRLCLATRLTRHYLELAERPTALR
jgi:hypothetical protein